MANEFKLTVLTPEKSVLDESVTYLQAPGLEGYFGVLANHAPLIAALMPGKFTVRKAGGTEEIYALSGGFLEVSDNTAVVLADALEPRFEIDRARAEAAEKRARDRLNGSSSEAKIDRARAEAALKRAINRASISR